MVLVKPILDGTSRVKPTRSSLRTKAVKHRRVVSRRVNVVVNESVKIAKPSNVHYRSIRFAPKPTAHEIASQQYDSAMHYTKDEIEHMSKEREQEAVQAIKVIKVKGTFQETDETSIAGLEELVYPEKSKERLQALHSHIYQVVVLHRNPMANVRPNETSNPAA